MNQRELEAGDSYGAQVDEQDPKQMQVGRLTALGTKKHRGRQQTSGRIQLPWVVQQLLAVLSGSSSRRSCCRGLQTTCRLKLMPFLITVSCTKAAAISCSNPKQMST